MADETELFASRYAIDLNAPLSDAGGGVQAFAARHHGNLDLRLMAVAIQRHLPARSGVLEQNAPIPGILMPLDHGVATGANNRPGYFIIAPAPTAPSLHRSMRVWDETELMQRVLRPAARALATLQARGLTHRGIRLDNVFETEAAKPVVLGTAWAAPPAFHQPAVYESPYSAMCLEAGRGEGRIADDIYSLGVVLLSLALGREPLAGLSDAAVIQAKLELGCFAAMTQKVRLPPAIADLVAGMLTADPAHRPTPAMLIDTANARGRRVAARTPRRAARGLPIGPATAWDARTLAYAVVSHPAEAVRDLRAGVIMHWIRRDLGDPVLAGRLDDAIRGSRPGQFQSEPRNADALLILRAAVLLDPLMPVCWRGVMLWPDGLGPALAAARETDQAVLSVLESFVRGDAISEWAGLRNEQAESEAARLDTRAYRAMAQTAAGAGGLARLIYSLNPLLPCADAGLGDAWVCTVPELMAALERTIGTRQPASVINGELVAFVASRSARRVEAALSMIGSARTETQQILAQLRVLAQLQARFHPGPLPRLTAWLAANADAVLSLYRNPARRAAIKSRLEILTEAGQLAPMLALLDNDEARAADAREAAAATQELARLDRVLSDLSAGSEVRRLRGVRLGREAAASFGLVALTLMLLFEVLS